MSSIRRAMQVPYSATQMYALVNDVTKYPEFLPWCEACEVIESDEQHRVALVTVSKAGFHRSFKTLNNFEQGQNITVQVKDSLFSHLQGVWTFTPQNNGSEISFSLDFQFKNALIKMTFARLVEQLANTVVSAFVKRAQSLYEQVDD